MIGPDERLGNAVLLESDLIRVWDHRVKAGETGHPHLHQRPYLSVAIRSGRGETIDLSGKVLQQFKLEPGQVYWYGTEHLPEAHALRNTGPREIVLVTVEFLASSLPPEAAEPA